MFFVTSPVFMRDSDILQDRLDSSLLHAVHVMARVLDLPATVVEGVFKKKHGVGVILSVDDMAVMRPLPERLEIHAGMSHRLRLTWHDELELFADTVSKGKPPQLNADAFSWIPMSTLVHAHLAHAVGQRAAGVNILLHGEPGTGKTEFARWVAKAGGGQLFEIAPTPRIPICGGKERFYSFLLAQDILNKHAGAVILFDEVEDLFRNEENNNVRSAGKNKAEFLNLLEDNPVPTIWITNKVMRIDQAVLRRFDLVVEIKTPPKRLREELLRRNLGSLQVSAAWLARAAEHDALTPGVLERACRVVANLASVLPADRHETLLEFALTGTLKAQGHRSFPPKRANQSGGYRLDLLNTDTDIEDLVLRMPAITQARLCLYGPSGTGKSALGRYLADKLGRPLLLKRASDLLSMWLGATEQRIADMFEEAREEGAVLLLDEADSFLRDRREARTSWEVTQVNELLTQMEAFDGLFVATTNLMDSLDGAVLRRFDLKVKFDYLSAKQARIFLEDLARDLNLRGDMGLVATRIERLDRLTPGDFAVVRRQVQGLGKRMDLETAVWALEREVAAKADRHTPTIGFVH